VKNKGPYNQLASGEFDKPSTSIREKAPLQAFNVSEMTAIQCMRLFMTKPFFPNIYNDLLSVDPVAIQFTRLLKNPLDNSNSNLDSLERDDEVYTLQNTDSIIASDALLKNSECIFKDKPEPISYGAETVSEGTTPKNINIHKSDEVI
jgi:hypothetical protein